MIGIDRKPNPGTTFAGYEHLHIISGYELLHIILDEHLHIILISIGIILYILFCKISQNLSHRLTGRRNNQGPTIY
jgi:hypothetical protein